jgi:hypothetical protein
MTFLAISGYCNYIIKKMGKHFVTHPCSLFVQNANQLHRYNSTASWGKEGYQVFGIRHLVLEIDDPRKWYSFRGKKTKEGRIGGEWREESKEQSFVPRIEEKTNSPAQNL